MGLEIRGKHDLYRDYIKLGQYKDGSISLLNDDNSKFKLIEYLNHRIKWNDIKEGKLNFIGNVIRTITVEVYKNIETGTNYIWLASVDK